MLAAEWVIAGQSVFLGLKSGSMGAAVRSPQQRSHAEGSLCERPAACTVVLVRVLCDYGGRSGGVLLSVYA